MKYILKTEKNENGNVVLSKETRKDGIYFLAKAESGEVQPVRKDWVIRNAKNIVNVGIKSDGSVYYKKEDNSKKIREKVYKEVSDLIYDFYRELTSRGFTYQFRDNVLFSIEAEDGMFSLLDSECNAFNIKEIYDSMKDFDINNEFVNLYSAKGLEMPLNEDDVETAISQWDEWLMSDDEDMDEFIRDEFGDYFTRDLATDLVDSYKIMQDFNRDYQRFMDETYGYYDIKWDELMDSIKENLKIEGSKYIDWLYRNRSIREIA